MCGYQQVVLMEFKEILCRSVQLGRDTLVTLINLVLLHGEVTTLHYHIDQCIYTLVSSSQQAGLLIETLRPSLSPQITN